jgi:hypothetical protein
MTLKLAAFALSAATLIAVGCSSESADDGEQGAAGALSATDCAPKADSEKASALSACQDANKFDLAGCRKPADDAFGKWKADVDAAYEAVKDKIDPITGACKNSVDELTCKDILTAAGKDFAAAANDQNACEAARATRKAKCDADASDAIQQALGGDTTYTSLVNQQLSVEAAYFTGVLSCEAQSTVKSAAAATCPALATAKRESAYLSCRHQCPSVVGSACTPAQYQGLDVQCGRLTSVSSGLGVFCESNAQCSRSSLCDKYDAAKSAADNANKAGSCKTPDGAQGFLVAKLIAAGGVDAGPPTDVTVACTPSQP